MTDPFTPFWELLALMSLVIGAIPAAKLLYAAYQRVERSFLARRQSAVAGDLGVDELALAACDTHAEQLELIDAKLREHEDLQRMRPDADRARTLTAHRRWVNEWLLYARNS